MVSHLRGPVISYGGVMGGALAPKANQTGNGNVWFVNPNATGGADGTDWDNAFITMQAAFNQLKSGDTILFIGNIREQVITPVNVFDITVRGCGNRPRNSDAVTSFEAQTSATWRGPVTPTAVTPLCKVLQQGWTFDNILFNAPTDAAAIQLFRNAGAGNLERDASHATIRGCRFDGGSIGIECIEVFNVLVEDCLFVRITSGTATAIKSNAGSGVALPLNWEIRYCRFRDNTNHIVASASNWMVHHNEFSAASVTLKIDFTGGSAGSILWNNYFAGTFSIAGGYKGAGAADEWAGNFTSTIAAPGITTADPA